MSSNDVRPRANKSWVAWIFLILILLMIMILIFCCGMLIIFQNENKEIKLKFEKIFGNNNSNLIEAVKALGPIGDSHVAYLEKFTQLYEIITKLNDTIQDERSQIDQLILNFKSEQMAYKTTSTDNEALHKLCLTSVKNITKLIEGFDRRVNLLERTDNHYNKFELRELKGNITLAIQHIHVIKENVAKLEGVDSEISRRLSRHTMDIGRIEDRVDNLLSRITKLDDDRKYN